MNSLKMKDYKKQVCTSEYWKDYLYLDSLYCSTGKVWGFLIAAKSIFRFGDLSKAKDRKLTEYILIGTLLSFGIAIACGVAYNYLSMHLG